MFIVVTSRGTEVSTFDLDFALICAVRLVSTETASAEIFEYDSSEKYFDVEQDTKVDEGDPYYPVIVHRRA